MNCRKEFSTPPHLTDVVVGTAMAADGVELVEQEDAPRGRDVIEDEPQLRSRLAEIAGD